MMLIRVMLEIIKDQGFVLEMVVRRVMLETEDKGNEEDGVK